MAKPILPSQPRRGRLPHERDQSPDAGMTGTDPATTPPHDEIEQAERDVERGLVDTDRRGTPNDVPVTRRRRSVEP